MQTKEQQLINVAAIVLRQTETKSAWVVRGRSRTRAASPDAIAESARQLAEMVAAYFPELQPQPDTDESPF